MGKEGIGDVFVDQIVVLSGEVKRFVSNSLTLQRLHIHVDASGSVLVGRQGRQLFPLANQTKFLTNIDLADLYFKGNTTTSTVTLLGTTKD